jgi:cell division protein FtsW (lipid II flippase)
MELVKLILKLMMIAVVYLGIGPGLGFYLKGRDTARRVVLGFMAWWLVRPPGDFTLMLYSIERYRGHTKGFEFNYLEALAMALSLAAYLEKRKDFKFLPPGLWVWIGWVVVCCASVTSAINPLYVWMPTFKFLKMGLVFAGVFHAIHDERDVRAIMRGFSIALILQLLVCLYFRYVKGAYRVIGWFEHQNPMAMWSYMLALPILGLAMSKQTKNKDFLLHAAAFGSAGLVVLLTVSRASLASFAIGTLAVLGMSFLQGFTVRRSVFSLVLVVGGVAAMAMAMDTFMERMNSAGDDSPENDLRWALNKQSAAMLADHPLTGIGWNNFGLANSRPDGEKYSAILEDWERNRGHAIYAEQFMANPLTESLYWLLLAENGYGGFAVFLLFLSLTLGFALRGVVRYWRGPLGLFLLGVLVALSLTYVQGRVERVLTQTKNLTTWIIFCAVVSRVEWWRRNGIDPDVSVKKTKPSRIGFQQPDS